jgi:hypothetical protein
MLAVSLLPACSTPTWVAPAGSATSNAPLVPAQSLQITSGTVVSLASLVHGGMLAAAVNFIYDPLAPNWEIEEHRLNDDTYQFSMKMKRFHTGGAGECMQIMKRRAQKLQIEHGYGNYQLLEYTEGIDSVTLGARRVAAGTIKLVQRQQADSFMLNDVAN